MGDGEVSMQWVQRLVGRFARRSSHALHCTPRRAGAILVTTAACLHSNVLIYASAETASTSSVPQECDNHSGGLASTTVQSDATADVQRFLADATSEASSGPRVWSGQILHMLHNVPHLICLLKDPNPRNQLLGAQALSTVLRYCVSSRPDLIKTTAESEDSPQTTSDRITLRSHVHSRLNRWIQQGLFESLLELCQSSDIQLRYHALESVELLMGIEEIFATDRLQHHMQQPAEAARGLQVFRAVLLDQTSMQTCEVTAGPSPTETPPEHEERNNLRAKQTARVLCDFMDDAVLKACTNSFELAGWEADSWSPFVSSTQKAPACRTANVCLAFLNDLFQTVHEEDEETRIDKTASALVHRIVKSGLLAAALKMIPDEDVCMDDKIGSVRLLQNCCWELNAIAPDARLAVVAQAKATGAQDLLSDLLMEICVEDADDLDQTLEFIMCLQQ